MKKLIFFTLSIFIIGLSVDANDSQQMQITGQILDIDVENQSFILADSSGQKHMFAITPNSQLKTKTPIEGKADFNIIENSKWVKISYTSGRQIHTVNEINIF